MLSELADRKREVPADFDRVARTYDTLVRRNPGYLAHLRLSADRLALPRQGAGLRLLDLCCGTGLSTEALLAAYPRADVTGLDASVGMLECARAKGLRATFVEGDAMHPRGDGVEGVFDAILMAYGIRNMPEPDVCLRGVRDLLAPDAPVVFHEYSVAGSRRARLMWNAVAFGVIIPGGLVTSRHLRIYRYLRRSVLDFDTVDAFEARLRRAGFTDVHTEPVDGWQRGIVHSFCARRPGVPTE
jgi:ubiquinone/menaquinone biosynthesis C-methylase UbiE